MAVTHRRSCDMRHISSHLFDACRYGLFIEKGGENARFKRMCTVFRCGSSVTCFKASVPTTAAYTGDCLEMFTTCTDQITACFPS